MAQINQKAADLVKEYLDMNGLKDPDGLVRYTHAVVAKYGDASSELACEMYDLTAEFEHANVPPAEPAPTATYQETAKAVYGSLKQSPTGAKVPGVAQRLTKQAAADTSMQNAIRDGAYWSWVPYGSETCAFCITLASQGYVKASKKVLSGNHATHIHANCKCEFVITFGNSTISGFDPDKYYDMYASHGGDIKSLRNDLDAQNRDKINAQKRDAYARRNITEREKGIDSKDKNIFTVDENMLKAKEYHDKFENLTEHKAVNESIYAESKQILTRRSGTAYEDIVAIDSRTGEKIAENLSSEKYGNTLRCGFSNEDMEKIDASCENFETIHNHPGSSIPSSDDIVKLFQRKKQSGSSIPCHNGKLYRVGKLKDAENVDKIAESIHNKVILENPNIDKSSIEYETSKQLIQNLLRKKYITFTER